MRTYCRLNRAALLLYTSFICAVLPARGFANDDDVAAIDAGRLVVMIQKISVLLKLPDVREPSDETPEAMLAFALARYDDLHALACRRNAIEASACARVKTPPPLAADLRGRVDAAESLIEPFWTSVCRKLDDPKQPICQLE